jgi:hypothetical protein
VLGNKLYIMTAAGTLEILLSIARHFALMQNTLFRVVRRNEIFASALVTVQNLGQWKNLSSQYHAIYCCFMCFGNYTLTCDYQTIYVPNSTTGMILSTSC